MGSNAAKPSEYSAHKNRPDSSGSNQVEIYFSVLQRKALTPNDFRSLSELEHRLLSFQSHYEQVAQPFHWRFTRRDLRRPMLKLNTASSALGQPAKRFPDAVQAEIAAAR